jgi:mRNA interferase RelE/StbE
VNRVVLHRRAARYLQRLPKNRREAIRASLEPLQDTEFPPPDAKKMVGQWEGYFRLRSGDVRILLWHDPEEKTIYVDHIGPRGDIYKR